MQNKYSKKQLEELYHCQIFKDTGFDNSHQFWTAHGEPIDESIDGSELFTYADGWDLDELHENIRKEIHKHCIIFDTNKKKEVSSKDIPKPVIRFNNYNHEWWAGRCPNCNISFNFDYSCDSSLGRKCYCSNCGQLCDFEDKESR